MSNEMTDHENGESRDLVLASMRALSPAPCQIERDRLMFLAGKASAGGASGANSVIPPRISSISRRRAPGQAWIWPVAATVFAATSIVLAGALALRPAMPVAFANKMGPIHRPDSVAVHQVPIETAMNQPTPAAASHPAAEIAFPSYLRTRDVAFRMGLDALGTPSSTATDAAPSYGELMYEISASTRPKEEQAAGVRLPTQM